MAAATKKKPVPAKKPAVKAKPVSKIQAVKTTSTAPKVARSSVAAFAPSMMSGVANFSSSSSQRLPSQVQALLDKNDIAEKLYTYARGVDRIDETLLRSVFHPDATLDLGPGVFQGTSGDYVMWLLGVMQQIRSSHHMIGNMRVELDGDSALVESYFSAHHRLDKPTGREDVFMGGRYLDRFERRPAGVAGIWKIMHRKQVLDFVRTESVSDIFFHQNPDALWSYRTKTDPSYQMAQFPGSQSGTKLPAFLGRKYESKSVKF